MSAEKKSLAKYWLLVVLAIVLDQITKVAVIRHFQFAERLNIIPNFFDLTLVYNTGAAFSFLADAGGWQRWGFTAFGLVAALFIIWQLRQHAGQRLFAFSLASILGGALGNVIDRLLHGYVVDFLDFHWSGYHFPAFNLADSAITVGAVCLIVDELLRVRRTSS